MSVGRLTVVIMADVAIPVPGIRSVPLADLDFTVVDVETTGWAPEDAGITEIGAVRVHGGTVIAEFGSLVNPGTPVPPAITELTGISDQMLTSAPPVAAVLPGLLAFAEGSVLAAHNAPFDLGVPHRRVRRHGMRLARLRGARHRAARQAPDGHAAGGARQEAGNPRDGSSARRCGRRTGRSTTRGPPRSCSGSCSAGWPTGTGS